jgi:hypothetical protein
MNEQITRQAQDMLAAVVKTEVPAEVRTMAQESVAKAREAYGKWTNAAQAGAKALEEMMVTTQSGAKTVGETVLGHAVANTEAAFDAARGLARARTLPEAAQLQVKFVQEQLAIVGEQGKGLLELTAKVAKETTDALTAIATRAAEDLKKVA